MSLAGDDNKKQQHTPEQQIAAAAAAPPPPPPLAAAAAPAAAPFASPARAAQLAAHKERVADKLQGIAAVADALPGILTAETAQIAAASKALLAREAGIHRTKDLLGQLPPELAAYDAAVDELQQRALDLERALHALGGGSSAGASAGVVGAATAGVPTPAATAAAAGASSAGR
jgi:type II secretory pathway component HofQ